MSLILLEIKLKTSYLWLFEFSFIYEQIRVQNHQENNP